MFYKPPLCRLTPDVVPMLERVCGAASKGPYQKLPYDVVVNIGKTTSDDGLEATSGHRLIVQRVTEGGNEAIAGSARSAGGGDGRWLKLHSGYVASRRNSCGQASGAEHRRCRAEQENRA